MKVIQAFLLVVMLRWSVIINLYISTSYLHSNIIFFYPPLLLLLLSPLISFIIHHQQIHPLDFQLFTTIFLLFYTSSSTSCTLHITHHYLLYIYSSLYHLLSTSLLKSPLLFPLLHSSIILHSLLIFCNYSHSFHPPSTPSCTSYST